VQVEVEVVALERAAVAEGLDGGVVFTGVEVVAFVLGALLAHHDDVARRLAGDLGVEADLAIAQVMVEQVIHLRSLGIKMAIDDFGFEHSDFERLKSVHWDYCKVDLTALKSSENLDWLHEAYEYCKNDGVQMVLERYEQTRPCEVIKSLKGAWIQGF